MTDEQWIELEGRAVAARGFRWMSGMLHPELGRVTHATDRGAMFNGSVPLLSHGLVSYRGPDLRDPATLGCLLELVRNAWGREAYTRWHATRAQWECTMDAIGQTFWAPAEAEALVAALEAAP